MWVEKEEEAMNVELTETELIMILDSIHNRIDDLNTVAMFGDGESIEGEIQDLTELAEKLEEACNDGQ